MEKKEVTVAPHQSGESPLLELVSTMREQVRAVGELQATVLSTQWAVWALIQTHPEPAKALEVFLDHMDMVADLNSQGPSRAEAMQRYRDMFSAAAAAQTKKG